MKRLFSLLAFGLMLTSLAAQGNAREQYINDYYQIAVQEMQTYGIPASITMAQGILESSNGQGYLATEAKNHFGIKCHDWTGPSVRKDDDEKDECFRKYEDAMQSFEDHSTFLTTRTRYDFLFELEKTDYKGWAKGLKKAGYATDPQYPEKLIKLIEDNELYLLDEYALAEAQPQTDKKDKKKSSTKEKTPELPKAITTPPTASSQPHIKAIDGSLKDSDNDVPYIVVQTETTYEAIANEYDLHRWEVYKFNDRKKERSYTPYMGEYVYLDFKRGKFHDKTATHKVKEGDTMHEISQLYGIRMRALYRINQLFKGTQPNTGDIIYLHRKARISATPKKSSEE